jgi:type IV pilus assembly protein PilM/plasmid segregation protein ParM
MQTLIRAAVQNLNVDSNQAQQFITKFGLYPDRLEGQILKSLDATLEQFASEVTKSTKFFQTRYPNIPVNSIVLSGYTLTIPAFAEYLSSKTGMQTVVGNAWANVQYSADMQDQLTQLAPQFAVAVGLAERKL